MASALWLRCQPSILPPSLLLACFGFILVCDVHLAAFASLAVLGRFLHSLNAFCSEAYELQYDVADYWVYDFAKVCNPGHNKLRPHCAQTTRCFVGVS
jgi:hypothetical protein